jgi:tripeptidyl-peptidase-1
MHISSLVVVAMLAAHSVATPRSRHILHEKRENTPAQWMKRNRLAPHIILPMRVGLSQNQDALNNGYRYLMDV